MYFPMLSIVSAASLAAVVLIASFAPVVSAVPASDIKNWSYDASKTGKSGTTVKQDATDIFTQVSGTLTGTDSKYAMTNIPAFVKAVMDKYGSNIPYHTFNHGVSALQFGYKAMNRLLKLQVPLTAAHKISFLIACFCHDIGHPGRTNDFVNLGSNPTTQAILRDYPAGKAVLERMHAGITEHILTDTTGISPLKPDLSPAEKSAVITLVKGIIMATDTSSYGDVKTNAKSAIGDGSTNWWADQANIPKILHLLMAAADLSNSVRGLPAAQAWTDQILQEFTAEAADWVAAGKTAPPYLVVPSDKKAIAASQLGFLRGFVSPIMELADSALKRTPTDKNSLKAKLDLLITHWESVANPVGNQ